MDERSTYDDDIFAWSQEQAAVLRGLNARRDLPNQLDLEHVAEEIEDVGKSELAAARSFARLIFIHLIKIVSIPEAQPAAAWRKEIRVFHVDFLERFSPAMAQKFAVEEIWHTALLQTEADFTTHGDQIASSLPATCPFILEDLLSKPIDVESLLRRIAEPSAAR